MISILLITNKGDVTTDFIAKRLAELNVEFYRLNTEDILRKVWLNFDFYSDEFTLHDKEQAIRINLHKIQSVYYRRPLLPNIQKNGLTEGEEKFIHSEINNCLEGLYKILKSAFWISPIFAIREAESKIYQLLIAKELGFLIPPSLITNQALEAKAFVNNFTSVVKPIKTGLIEENGNEKIIFTTKFDEVNEIDRIESCPTYFQKFIHKVSDLRVTVIGNKVFPALILSQAHSETKVDWRKGEGVKLKYEKFELPESLINLCIQLTKKLGLNFGAIDFVVDENNNFYFLEINPNGQWAWIEKQLGYNLSHELSNLLIYGKN